jgi:hypothetical protein
VTGDPNTKNDKQRSTVKHGRMASTSSAPLGEVVLRVVELGCKIGGEGSVQSLDRQRSAADSRDFMDRCAVKPIVTEFGLGGLQRECLPPK